MSSSILLGIISNDFDRKDVKRLILLSKRLIFGEEGRYMRVKSPFRRQSNIGM